MSKYLKDNYPILILILIIIGGFYYSFKTGNGMWISRSNLECSGIDVPAEIKYVESKAFCSCIRMSPYHTQEEKSQSCIKKFIQNKNNFYQ